MFQTVQTPGTSTTPHQVVIPFYVYGAFSFLIATLLLFLNSHHMADHYFIPGNLAITHIMALGWGTMIIMGASHQLVPVLIEAPLYSTKLAHLSFYFAALGIPLLAYGFFTFNLGSFTQLGGLMICLGLTTYLVNLAISMTKSKSENVHAFFILTAVIWLLSTAIVGFLLLLNFTHLILPKNSLAYLPLHAHMGIIGWFLLLVMGVGSRLIPMFVISKYTNNKLLWWIYGLVNGALILYLISFLYFQLTAISIVSTSMVLLAVILFCIYCFRAYKSRIRKSIDAQVQLSIAAVWMMLLPLICLFIIFYLFSNGYEYPKLIVEYGFIIFFGWVSSIILGMTFKTLPFIVWNKLYLHLAGKGKTPSPKDLFSQKIFRWMSLTYFPGFILFALGIRFQILWLLQLGAIALILAAVLYNFNILKLIFHKPNS